MSMTPVASPVVHLQHYIEIPFTWASDRAEDEAFQFETWERIEAEANRVCFAYGLELDPAGAISQEGIRLKGNSLDNVNAAGAELARFLVGLEGLVFQRLTEDRV